jgi:hypothetical protein
MRTLLLSLIPAACALAACGPSDSEVAEAERSKSARSAAAVAGLAEPPLDLGEGLILTVLQRGSGAFVSAGGRVRVHYDASVVAIAEEPTDETDEALLEGAAEDAEVPAEGDAPVEGAAESAESETGSTGEAASGTEPTPAPEPATQTPPEPAAESAPAADAPPPAEPAQEPTADAGADAQAATADPAAPPTEAAAPPAAAAVEATLPWRFDSSRARGVPDTWDLSRTASPRLIEGLRRGLIGLTAGSRLTLRIPAALAWGDEGLRNGNVPPRADVLYEIELLEVLP